MFGVPTNHLGPGHNILYEGGEVNEELLSNHQVKERSNSYVIDLSKLCKDASEERIVKQVTQTTFYFTLISAKSQISSMKSIILFQSLA